MGVFRLTGNGVFVSYVLIGWPRIVTAPIVIAPETGTVPTIGKGLVELIALLF
jgi:hypothetical protein